MRQTKIQKSVRLPEEMVQFIEKAEGADFSSKLMGILNEYFLNEDFYKNRIQHYEELVERRRKTCNGYYALIRKTRTASQQYEELLRQLQIDIERLDADGTRYAMQIIENKTS